MSSNAPAGAVASVLLSLRDAVYGIRGGHRIAVMSISLMKSSELV
jgi:hypothetical protein